MATNKGDLGRDIIGGNYYVKGKKIIDAERNLSCIKKAKVAELSVRNDADVCGSVTIKGDLCVDGCITSGGDCYDCTVEECTDCCPSTKVEDTSLLFAGIAQCNLFTQLRMKEGSYIAPQKFQFDKAVYPPFLNFQSPPPDTTTFGIGAPLPNFIQDKMIEYYTAKGTLDIYKDPAGTSTFFIAAGGATQAEADIHNSFAFEGTPGAQKNYIILQSAPNYDGPFSFGANLDTPNVWNLLYKRGTAVDEISQINTAVANLKAGLTVDGIDPATLDPPKNVPNPVGDWEIIEWIITPGNPLGDLPTINHNLDAPVGNVDWLPRKIFVVDAAFSTPAFQPVGKQDVVQHALDLVTEIRTTPTWELISFGSLSKQFGYVSTRFHYTWLSEAFVTAHPNWVQWYNKSGLVGACQSWHSAEFILNRMQYELDTDLGAQIDADFHSNNVRIQQALLNEFNALFPGNVTLLSCIGGPVMYLEFDDSVRGAFPTITDFLTATYSFIVNSGVQYNYPSAIPIPEGVNQARFPTCNGTDDYVAVLNRLAGFNKYTPEEFLVSGSNVTSCQVVKSVENKPLVYVPKLDDQVLIVDATLSPITIELPSLQSFACTTRHIHIKNISKCDTEITIRTSSVVPTGAFDIQLPAKETKVYKWESLASLDDGKWVEQ